MSYDLAVWFPHHRLTDEEAATLTMDLSDGVLDGVQPHPAVEAFYHKLTALHPEIDTIPEDRLDDSDYCPWSCALDHSPDHVWTVCIGDQAENVHRLVRQLAQKHGLPLFNPQEEVIHYPQGEGKKAWWRG